MVELFCSVDNRQCDFHKIVEGTLQNRTLLLSPLSLITTEMTPTSDGCVCVRVYEWDLRALSKTRIKPSMSLTVLYDSINWSTSRWPKLKCNRVVHIFGHCYFYPSAVCSYRGLISNACVVSSFPDSSYFNNSYLCDVPIVVRDNVLQQTSSIWLWHHIIMLFIEC